MIYFFFIKLPSNYFNVKRLMFFLDKFGNLNLRPFEFLVAFNNFLLKLKKRFHSIKKSNSLSLSVYKNADDLYTIFKQDF